MYQRMGWARVSEGRVDLCIGIGLCTRGWGGPVYPWMGWVCVFEVDLCIKDEVDLCI